MKTLLDREDLVFNPPELGCVLYLPGLPGGGSKIYDRSPYGNQGTITGATWVKLPSGLWCLSFDGSDDYVDCGAGGSLDITIALTLEAWVKPVDVSAQYGIICKKGFYDQYALGIRDSQFIFAPNEGLKWLAGSPQSGVWQHVIMTVDSRLPSDHVKLYKNGAAAGNTGELSAPLVSNNEPVIIGKDAVYNNHFNGRLALTRIYNRALSALEIQNHFNREKHLFGVWSR